MEFAEARQIFRSIKSDRYTDEEKGAAIYRIIRAENIKSISKGEIMNVVRWLFFRCFEIEIQGGKMEWTRPAPRKDYGI